MPTPVVVVKDVGGFVADYQTQTAIYRVTGREVRLHECRSACTLALSLPNVCVYPNSTLKFHLAYDPRNRVVNPQVSGQMFASYPAPVQARLGSLTREYKVLRGDELIALGVRDCNAPKPNEPQIMVASEATEKPLRAAEPSTKKPLFAGMFDKMSSVFGIGEVAPEMPSRAAFLPRSAPGPNVLLAEIPVPPQRPGEFGQTKGPDFSQPPGKASAETGGGSAEAQQTGPLHAKTAEAPLTALQAPPPAEVSAPARAAARQRSKPHLPAIITGAQPILPPQFRAYAELDR